MIETEIVIGNWYYMLNYAQLLGTAKREDIMTMANGYPVELIEHIPEQEKVIVKVENGKPFEIEARCFTRYFHRKIDMYPPDDILDADILEVKD